jgi:hypothetical protein
MNASLQELMQTISEMRDDELLAIVHSDPSHYRLEALVYAQAEINRRALTYQAANANNPPMPLVRMTVFFNRLAQAIRGGAFHLGFVITLVIFWWLDYRSTFYVKRWFDHSFIYSGFPLNRQRSGGNADPSIILWPGFIADVAIALLASVFVGWVLMRVVRLAIPNSFKTRSPGSL